MRMRQRVGRLTRFGLRPAWGAPGCPLPDKGRIGLAQRLLELIMGVRLVVERRHLPKGGPAVKGDVLRKHAVRFQMHGPHSLLSCEPLQPVEQPATDAEAARIRIDPHPLDLGRRVTVQVERPAPDRYLGAGTSKHRPQKSDR